MFCIGIRQEKRKVKREQDKLEKKVQKLDATTIKLIESLAEMKFKNYINVLSDAITEVAFEAMRENRIGEDRANKIIEEMNSKLHERAGNNVN